MRVVKFLLIAVFAIFIFENGGQAQTKIVFEDKISSQTSLVLGVYENRVLGKFGKIIDRKSRGSLSYAIQVSGFNGEAMETLLIPAPKGSGVEQILLMGLGSVKKKHSDLRYQHIGGNAVQKAIKSFGVDIEIATDLPVESVAQFALGVKLGSYYFDRYFTEEDRNLSQEKVTIISSQDEEAQAFYNTEIDPVANGIWLARDISNEPANVIYPQSFVDRWTEYFDGLENISIKVIDEKEMLEKQMGAIYGVGQGSHRPPRMMIVEYAGGKKGSKPVVIAGKGITFDTGGLSLKNPPNMWNMKFDMSGAASTMGTLYALAARGAEVNVVGIAALAENMPSGKAQRPGDVVKSMSGKTIQIRSTDAEGRLVLADGLYYADTVYDPVVLINLATLTGSARRALGGDYAALFSRHDSLAHQLLKLSKTSGDGLWRLPLNDNHFRAIQNNVADVMNSGPTAPGASAGAAFLGTFVRETTPWAHLDIAGIAYADKATPTKASPGSRGYGIRLLNAFIKTYHEGQ
ncbi:leucyl aminopeptidase [Temperatibacter marinus]|uniref:Probable cytosol aminopeptidase n=1 Tax=Temperatibacter marinus TaxID=1456591 RepID=A0AA52EHF2_9PROT|nr:leucyl aminopeptidase [Temperatibacter marinus]WND02577.1 leucyl aminopeptidase [Temperatibacter marinus]